VVFPPLVTLAMLLTSKLTASLLLLKAQACLVLTRS
jgi:hypothetical protein